MKLPHSEETERAILGCLLLDPALLDQVGDQLQPRHFHAERHQLIYRAMRGLGSTALDFELLRATLDARGELERAGGVSELAGLDASLPDPGRIELYVAHVKDLAARRDLYALAAQMAQDATGAESLADSLADAVSGLQALQAGSVPAAGGYRGSDVAADEAEAAVDAEPATAGVVKTGFPGLDSLLVSLEPAGLYYLPARTTVGKTSAALDIVSWNLRRGHACGIVALEQARLILTLRLLAKRTEIPLVRFRRRNLTATQRATAKVALAQLREQPLWIDDSGGQSMADIATRARRLHKKHPLQLLVVDYIGLVESSGENRTQEVARVSRGLAVLAKELAVPILVCAQLSRRAVHEKRPPILSDLQDSGAQEQDAAAVVFIHRPPREDNPSLLEQHGSFIVAKHRDGETGEVPVVFDGPVLRFREVSEHHGDAEGA